jgi:hypothetical protein
MTAHDEDDLTRALADELDSMNSESAERLTNILRGLFGCLQDLDSRVKVLERDYDGGGEG